MLIILIQLTVYTWIWKKVQTFMAIFRSPQMNSEKFSNIKFKHQFKNLNFYSMPDSILIALRRRLLKVGLFIALLLTFLFSIL